MTIEFTNEEATILVQLLDMAVKSGGLQVASAALALVNKLEEASKKGGEAK